MKVLHWLEGSRLFPQYTDSGVISEYAKWCQKCLFDIYKRCAFMHWQYEANLDFFIHFFWVHTMCVWSVYFRTINNVLLCIGKMRQTWISWFFLRLMCDVAHWKRSQRTNMGTTIEHIITSAFAHPRGVRKLLRSHKQIPISFGDKLAPWHLVGITYTRKVQNEFVNVKIEIILF